MKTRIRPGQITPWGKSQSSYEYANGMREYHTAGHGGIFVKKALRATMPPELVNPDGWYEEDCEVIKVMKAFPAMFTPEQVESAKKSFDFWFNSDGTYKQRG